MTGVLETMRAELTAATAAIAALQQQFATLASGGGGVSAAAPAAADPFAGFGAPAPAASPPPPANIGEAELTALIQPHIDNPAMKAALGAAMREAGIASLQEIQPAQYAGLYAKFQQVIAAGGAAPAAAGTPSSLV